jgi:tape measure domain-containing protein
VDIERIVVRMGADATQYLRVFDVVEARLVAFSSFLVEEMLRSSMRLAMEFERMGIAFEVMTGSAERGKQVLSDIVDLAIRTPFTTQELVKSGKQAMAFGFEMHDIIPVLSRLGDVSVATGSDMDRLILALGQVRTTGRLMGQELRQFTNAGVPILQYLSKAIGVSEAAVPQLVRMGQVSFNDVAEAFNLMTNQGGRFFGMMERTNLETVFGKWQNFTENIQRFSRRIGESIFAAFDVKGLLSDMNSNLNAIDLSKITDGMKTFRDAVVASWNVLKAMVDSVKEFADAHPDLTRLVVTVSSIAAGLVAISAGVKVGMVMFGVFAALAGPLVGVLGLMGTGLLLILKTLFAIGMAFAFGFGALAIPILTKVALAIGIATIAIIKWREILGGAWDLLKGFGSFASEVFMGVADTIGSLLLGAAEQLGRSLGRLFDTFVGLGDIFTNAGKGIFAAFVMGDTDLGFKLMIETVKFGFKVLMEWIKVEWGLMWTEVGINMITGLKVRWAEFVAFAGRTVGALLRPLGITGGNTDAQINARRDQDIARFQAEGQKDLADATIKANDEIRRLVETMRALPEVQQINQMQAHARAVQALGHRFGDFMAEVETQVMRYVQRGNTGRLAPDIEIGGAGGVVPAALLEGRYESMYMDAARKMSDFWTMELSRAEGHAIGFGKTLVTAARASGAFEALNRFKNEITGVAAAARDAAANLSKTIETSAETRAFWLNLSKDMAKGTTALDAFQRHMNMIHEAAYGPLNSAQRHAFGAGLGAAAAFGGNPVPGVTTPGSPEETFALFREFDQLRRSLPKPEDRRPPAALEGSREAAEIIGRSQQRQASVQEEIRATLIQANEIHRQAAAYQREVAEEMRKLKNEGVIVPLPVRPG